MAKYSFSFATWHPGRPHFSSDCLPRLALEPTMSGTGLFDGAWWPRSDDATVELPDLITALGFHVGRIRRVALDTRAWRDVPRSVMVNGDAVRIGWLTASAGTIALSRGIHDHHLFLVVPPATTWQTAAAAMATAAMTGNRTPARDLLDADSAPLGW